VVTDLRRGAAVRADADDLAINFAADLVAASDHVVDLVERGRPLGLALEVVAEALDDLGVLEIQRLFTRAYSIEFIPIYGSRCLRGTEATTMDPRAHLNKKLRFCITPYSTVPYVKVKANVSRTGEITHGA
jgi:hypothetical protein